MKKFTIGDLRLAISFARFPFAILGRTGVAPIPNRQSPIASAFSLVEVVLALGIVSFCLLAIVGLLPVGLKAVKNANEQAGAAQVVDGIADALRKASSTNGTNFAATFAGGSIAYTLGGGNSSTNQWPDLDLNGTSDPTGKRLSARLEILQQPTAIQPGRAVISVAWPAQANPTWNSANQTWSNAEGSVTTAIQFLPKP
jgi:type II secretory pathway pseudopilin PulG